MSDCLPRLAVWALLDRAEVRCDEDARDEAVVVDLELEVEAGVDAHVSLDRALVLLGEDDGSRFIGKQDKKKQDRKKRGIHACHICNLKVKLSVPKYKLWNIIYQ